MLHSSAGSDVTTPIKSGIQALRNNLSPSRPQDHPGLIHQSTPGARPSSSVQDIKSATSSTAQVLSSVDYALNAPTLYQRCYELSILLGECPQKDLAVVFHTILEKIFCLSSGGRGWAISAIQRTAHTRDFLSVSEFLSSNGPLLQASYRLLSDPYLRYEFPVSLLSPSTQQHIESGNVTPFLATKLSPQNSSVLQLNSFEFYMFTFAAYIVQPYTADNKFVPGESLYPHVLEDYFAFFLPCDGSTPPSLPFTLTVPTAPIVDTVQKPQPVTPSRRSLLKNSSFASPSPARSPPTSSVVTSPSGHEIWRSETLINTISEFWLTPFSPPSKSKNDSPYLNNGSTDLMIAVCDTLKIVRMMIKHLHYFANSGGPEDIIPLDQLKRCVLPSIRKQLYLLFKYIFTHWPHDMSFRMVLETWLSYIQPWRYTDGGKTRNGDETASVTVDQKWQLFVAENILFYTNILKLLLPRFFRMDLTSCMNAYMLFRIAKIYSQVGLAGLVKQGEAGLDRGLSGSGLYMPGILDYIEVSENVTAAARQSVMELEGAGAKYDPIFGNQFRQTVSDLLAMATRAQSAAQDNIAEFKKEEEQANSGLSWLSVVLGGTDSSLPNSAEINEHKKSVSYLSQSIASLTTVFDLEAPETGTNGRSRMYSGVPLSPGKPEQSEGLDGGLTLTPHGRWQVLHGLARPDVRYEGDPDLMPITHSEVTWLVRLMHAASQWLNEMYGEKLVEFYSSEGLAGEVARLLLAPPAVFYTLEKTLDGTAAKRKVERHKARVSLRILGNKQVIMYLVLAVVLLSFLLRSSLLYALFFLLLLAGMVVFGKSVLQVVKRKTSKLPQLPPIDSSPSAKFD